MTFPGLCKGWLVVATLSLLAGPAFAASTLSFVCDGDLVARPECCCPGGHRGTVSADERASASPACCCRVSRTDARPTRAIPAPRAAAPVDAKSFAAPAVLVLDSSPPTRRAWPVTQLAQPPPRAVPIRLVKQSFLI